MREDGKQGWRWLLRPLLWSWLVSLVLPHVVHANTLAKLRVVDSNSSSQVLLFTTHPAAYQLIPLLEQNLLLIHLDDTARVRRYALPAFTGPLIREIRIIKGAHASSPTMQAGTSDGGVTVEVALKTSEVSFTHKPLTKSPGVVLVLRKGKSTPKPASPKPASQEPKREAKEQGPAAVEISPPTDSGRPPPPTQSPTEERPDSRPKAEAPAPRLPPREASLPAIEDVQGLMGRGGRESLTLLQLYLNHQPTFRANLSLLWQVAATYADVALYDEADALYTKILEEADNPLLRGAALLKRAKITLLKGDETTAETLLQQFVKGQRHGPMLGEAYEALGDALAAHGKFDGAVGAYTVGLSHTPEAQKPAHLLYKLGRAHKMAGNWPEAAEAFQKTLERLPGQTAPEALEVATLQQLGESLSKTQQYQSAAAAYRRVLERSSEAWQLAWARYHLGKSYEKLGNSDEALQAYRELAQQVDPFWAEIGSQALADMKWRGRYQPN